MKVAQSRQKSYADKRRRDLVFEIGNFVYLKVSPMKGVKRFHTKGKLSPKYVGPFKKSHPILRIKLNALNSCMPGDQSHT